MDIISYVSHNLQYLSTVQDSLKAISMSATQHMHGKLVSRRHDSVLSFQLDLWASRITEKSCVEH
jgi:hypothetical protein